MQLHELLLIHRPQTDRNLSWPSWLTHNGQFTRTVYPQSGHLSTIDRTQVRESPPAKDRRLTQCVNVKKAY